MADLPKCRLVSLTPPFYYTSSDHFGPCNVTIGRNRNTKHYGNLLWCLNTQTVLLELAVAVDQSTMEIIQVLRRFFAVRGCPNLIISDIWLEQSEDWEKWPEDGTLTNCASAAEIYYSSIPTSEWMCRNIGKEQQTSSRESYWGTSVATLWVVHVPARGSKSRQPASSWSYSKCFWWWILPLPERRIAWTSYVSSTKRPFHRDKESPSLSGIFPTHRWLVLEALDKGCVPVITSAKEVACRKPKRKSGRLRDSGKSKGS